VAARSAQRPYQVEGLCTIHGYRLPYRFRQDDCLLCDCRAEWKAHLWPRTVCFVSRFGGLAIAGAPAIWNAFNTRLLDPKAIQPGGDGPLIRAIVAALAAEQGQVPHSVAVDVRADAIALHQDLCDCGFLPTVYYPALFADGDGRSDAVQFTRLAGFDLETAQRSAELSEWPQAEAIAARVGPSGMAGFASGLVSVAVRFSAWGRPRSCRELNRRE